MTAGAIERDSPARSSATTSVDDSLPVFVARDVVPGCVATALVAIGAIGLGWLPMQRSLLSMPVIHALQGTVLGTAFAAVSLVTGIVLLMFAWLQVGNDVARGNLTDVRRMWVALAAWSAPLILTPPLFSRDAYSYVAQGRLFLSGLNPYAHAPSELPNWSAAGVDPLWANTPSPYGQVFNVLARGAVDIGGPNSYLSAMLFRVLALVGIGLLAWAVPQLARSYGINPAWALWLGVLNPLVVMHFVSGAHNDALMVGLIAAGLAVAARKQPLLGVVLVTLAGGVKPIGLVALPFIGLIWAGPKAPMSQIIRRWVASAAVCLVDAIRNGTTTLIDHHASQTAIDVSLDVIADAVTQSGVRACLCCEVTDRDGPAAAQAGIRENVRFARDGASGKWQAPAGGRLAATFGLHASLTLSDETLEACAGEGSRFHIHVAEHPVDEYDSLARSGKRCIERLHAFGITGPRSIMAHCIHVDAWETGLLRETRTFVAHQPRSNMNNAVGAAEITP
ncbi:MAG: polyprenol phosphomannose-dependent alpha 1,6 mannosyltransferase MptB, partial [Actinomycetes bacterium]